MRTHDSHVDEDADRAAITGNPATISTPAAPASNVRVAPAASHGRKAAPGPGGAWCADDLLGADRAQDRSAPDRSAPDRSAPDRGAPTTGAPDTGEAPDAARRPGRPRSERAEQSIIEATIEALAERGIDGVHCEDVAARAGVGKATLYRRWGGKEDLLIAAFAAMKHPLPEPRGESVRDDLIALLSVIAADADDPRFAQQYALLHGAGERYPRLVARYKEQVVEPRRELVRSVLRRGIEARELRADIDVEVAMLMLTGAVMARGKHDPAPAAPGFVDRAVDELLRGIAADR
jgi:AcrR family transcriptional regulator